MLFNYKKFYLLALLGASLLSLRAEQAIISISKPLDNIFDDENILEAQNRGMLVNLFRKFQTEISCEVFLIVVPNNPRGGIKAMTRQLCEDWAKEGEWLAFYQVGTDTTRLGAITGGHDMLKITKDGGVEKAKKLASLHIKKIPDKQSKIYTYCSEITHEVSFISKKQHKALIATKPIRRNLVVEILCRVPHWVWGILGLFILLLSLIIWAAKRKRYRAVILPEVEWRTRLQGLYSGGGNVFTPLKNTSKSKR